MAFTGGQAAADAALAAFDVTGYADRRNEVWPPERRGASMLSPYIRHGLLPLRRVWEHVSGGPSADVERFRDELLWQEYARHLYARMGTGTRRSLRFVVPEWDAGTARRPQFPEGMACLDLARGHLEEGWLTNQERMWLAAHGAVREGRGWREGEDHMFRHLLDGSRAANRLGWQWVSGALTGRQYGFSRWQVERRAPGLCRTCVHRDDCPIAEWPDETEPEPRHRVDPLLRRDDDPEATAGPAAPLITGVPEAVWITAESLGDDDPALAAHPDLPVHFVWDEPLLARLRLSDRRLAFIDECLADLGTRRDLRVHRGDPAEVLAGTALAATFAPVPGWRRLSGCLDVVAVHPWPWLVRPTGGSLTSFTAWRRSGPGATGRPRPRR